MLNYVADFYAHEIKLVIELDGSYHADPMQAFYDKERTAILEDRDVTIIRFQNYDVFYCIEEVLQCIREKILELKERKQLK